MDNQKTFFQNSLVKILAGFILLTLTCCERSFQNESIPNDPFFKTEIVQWRDLLRFFRMAVYLSPNIQLQILYGMDACGCDEEDVSSDDHLSVISVPIFYLDAGGGSDNTGDYTSSLMARTNLTYYLVLVSGTDPASDYGHADVRFEYNADKT